MLRDDIRADLIRDEGKRNAVYKCPAGKNTIGYGRNLDDVGLSDAEQKHLGVTAQDLIDGRELTDADCLYLLGNDIESRERQLDKEFPWWRTRTDGAQKALVEMAFQLGIGGLIGFPKMLACVNAGDYAGAAEHAKDSKWAKEDTPARAARVIARFTEATA